MLKENRKEQIEKEIVALRDNAFSSHYNIETLSISRNGLIKGKFNLSFAWIIYRVIQAINIETAKVYNNTKNNYASFFFKLHQWEWDDIFEICIKANRLGLQVFPKINPNNDLSYLDPVEQTKLLEVYTDALNKYYDILLKRNLDYIEEENCFLNKMMTFGDNHNMNEEELVEFANRANQMGINVADINTQEELDEIYKKVFPEA